MIRVALRASHHASCLHVTDYLLPGLVPLELSAEDIREVAEVAEVGHADRRFDVHNRFGAGLDSVEPILLVAGTLVNIFGAGGRLPFARLLLDPRAAVAAPMDEFAVIAVVNRAVIGAADFAARLLAGSFFGGHGISGVLIPGEHPIGIPEGIGHVQGDGTIPQAFGRRRTGRLDGDRGGPVGAHPPHGTAHNVCAAVADLSAAGLHYPTEGAVTVSLVVRPPAQRAEPHIPVQLGRWVAIGDRIVIDGAVVVEASDLLDAADIAIDEVAMREIGFGLGASLRADLDRNFVLFGGGHHRLAFLDGAAGGLFDIDVLAALGRVNHLNGVPVVGRGYDDGVDVLALEDITVISIGIDAGAGGLDRSGEALLIDVADRRYVDSAVVLKSLHITQMEPTHSADADMGHRQALARAGFGGPRQHSGRNQIGYANCRGAGGSRG